jgi:hypothetical protein
MAIIVPISEPARRYGYVYWPVKMDEKLRQLLRKRESVDVVFEEKAIGEKRIDWQHRRISVGWKQTRALAKELKAFRLTIGSDGRLRIRCHS